MSAILDAEISRPGGARCSLRWAQGEGLKTKSRVRLDRQVGGKAFEYGSIRCLLGNGLYVGEIEHKG